MKKVKQNGLTYYQFELLAGRPELSHGVFTRRGGVGRPPREGLNTAFGPDEDEAAVLENISRACGALELDRPASAGQVHGDRALVVRLEDGYAPRSAAEVRRGWDALITPDPGLSLLIKTADCQGVILYSPDSRVLAVVHSGWRGSALNILGKTAAKMKRDFDVEPASVLAGVGPSLGPCCAEFVNYREELPPHFLSYRTGDCHFDFWAASADQLAAAGLKRSNIEISGLCTKCGEEGFYSHRRGDAGRFAVLAGMKGGGA